jgi:branched-chain amino acid transport system substrate-binding protein
VKRRALLVSLALGLVAVVAAILVLRSRGTATVRIGVLVPLTGGAASYGENARKGADLALKDFSARHPGVHVELRVEDSRGEAAVGNRAAIKLMDLDRVVAIMGDVTSGVTLAVAPQANERRVPLVSPGASSPNITDAGEYVFRTWPSDVFEADAMVRYIAGRKIAKLAMLRVNNEYGAAMEAAVRAKLRAQPVPVAIAAVETFEQGAREMRAQALRIKEAGPDGIYFIGFPEAAVVFARAYAETGLHVAVFATSAFEDPQVPRDSGGALDGTVYTKPQSSSPRVEAFRAAYRAAYGQDPSVVSDTAYDATMLILEAIAATASSNRPVTGEAVHDYLLHVRDYTGASGVLSFDANGDVLKPIGLFSLRGGRYEELPR